MSDEDSKNSPVEPTVDGKRLSMRELNMGIKPGDGRVRRFFTNLSQFLAGMYTGESCAGTPHSERQRDSGENDSAHTGKAEVENDHKSTRVTTEHEHEHEQGPQP